MIIHESFQSFINEEEKASKEPLKLFQVEFKEEWKIQATKGNNKGTFSSQGPMRLLLTTKQAEVLNRQPQIAKLKNYGEFKDKDTANEWLKIQSQRETSDISGSVGELKAAVELMKSMVLKKDKKDAEERDKEKKDRKNEGNYLGIPGLDESKVAEYIMDLLEKWYKNKNNKNILKQIMDIRGIDDEKKLLDVLNRNVDAYTAFNSLMQMESVKNDVNMMQK
jgi:hypothetical protein